MKTLLRKFTLWAGWRAPTAKDIPTAVPMIPPSTWRLEFHALQVWMTNAGLAVSKIRYEEIHWYACTEIPTRVMNAARPLNGATYHPNTVFAGVWMAKDKSIVLLAGESGMEIVRHEMTHAIAKDGAPHTARYFRPEWGNYMRWEGLYEKTRARLAEAQADSAKLREALRRHGAHDDRCAHLTLLTSNPPRRLPCDCGLTAAIDASRQPDPAPRDVK